MAKKKSTKKQKEEEKVVVDDDDDASTSSSEAEGGEEEAVDDGESSSGSGSGSGEEDSNESSDSGSSDEDDDGNNSSDDDESVGEDNGEDATPSHVNGDNNEQCTFDLTNLLAFNTHQMNAAELYQKTSSNKSSNVSEWYATEPTIPATTTTNSKNASSTTNESLLLAKAAEGATQLLRELWKLPTEKTDAGPMAKLPSGGGETKLPRSLPPPPPKQLTKWEQFALQRGIAPKSKRSRKVFDESTNEWKHLTGSLQNKANAGPESWPILEVKKNDDPFDDPWEKIREERKGRVNKNVEARMRNAERFGSLERGSANKFKKNQQRLEKAREITKERDRAAGLVAPAGVPLDVRGDAQRGKPSTRLALRATQVSTASLGKFDKQREGEPERAKHLSKMIHGNKKRKQTIVASSSSKGGGMTEAQKSADILQRVMNGSSSKEKEREIKRGKYARGETAFDYEYDDGLGNGGSFKKKKGRAGMGKMRKVTKKRMK